MPVASPAPRQQDSQLHPRERAQGSQEACVTHVASLAQHPICRGTDWMPSEGHRCWSCRGSRPGFWGAVSQWRQEALRQLEPAAHAQAGRGRGAAVPLPSAENFPLGPGFRHHGNCWGTSISSLRSGYQTGRALSLSSETSLLVPSNLLRGVPLFLKLLIVNNSDAFFSNSHAELHGGEERVLALPPTCM